MSKLNTREIADKTERAVKQLSRMKLTASNVKKICKKEKANPKQVGKILGLKKYKNGKYQDLI